MKLKEFLTQLNDFVKENPGDVILQMEDTYNRRYGKEVPKDFRYNEES